jgi:dephospho-CoA kinase
MEPIVLGIAGGIGSGKSTVARAFAALGWVVVDSDQQAAAALLRDDVRGTLVQWWGSGVLDSSGMIDRKAVGRIVFADAAERKRLEELIHPLIARGRRDAIAAATAAAGRAPDGVVYDAPLLFEAGLDRECDAVVFVDAPRERRLERVRASRGWDEHELAKREASQWPLDRKRAGCRFVVVNDGDARGVDEQVRHVAAILTAERGSGTSRSSG